jgi:hypothetical protein
MPGMQHGMQMNAAGMYLMNMASGTSVNPSRWQMPMLMPRVGSWNLMFMGDAFLVDTQQAGPRGSDKFYSANAVMGVAEHALGGASFMFETMLSLEPATVRDGATRSCFRPVRPPTAGRSWTRSIRTGYSLPSAIKPFYGDRPWAVNVYLRFRLKPMGH